MLVRENKLFWISFRHEIISLFKINKKKLNNQKQLLKKNLLKLKKALIQLQK